MGKIKRSDRCYVSGKISGLNFLEVLKNFEEGEQFVIKELHLIPVNPLNNGLRPSRPWTLHMAADLWMMLKCGHVLFLSNAKESRGSMIEYRLAKMLRMDMWTLTEE